MTIEDTEVRAVLHRATDHLTSPPTLLEDVRRGGRRRLVRRRAVLAGGLTLAAAASAGGIIRLGGASSPVEAASPLLDEPTRGDLAGDAAFLRQVRRVWRRDLGEGAEWHRGEVHVVWAGNTPAGPAAFVAQRTSTNPVVSSEGDRLIADVAFIHTVAGELRLMFPVTNLTAGSENGVPQAALLGAERDVLLVLDPGRPVEYSPELRYAADGKILRTFRRVTFRDGAAVLRVMPQRTRLTVVIGRVPVSPANEIFIANEFEIVRPGSQGAPKEITQTLAGAGAVWGPDPRAAANRPTAQLANALAPYVDAVGVHSAGTAPLLTVYGATPDGRRLLVQTMQYDDDPAVVVVLLARGDAAFRVVASGFLDWSKPLAVQLRLPDGQGVLVAKDGAALSYRVGQGAWHDDGRTAALLPADATECRVAQPDGSSVTVSVG